MINLHESMGPDRDRTCDPWICNVSIVCKTWHAKLLARHKPRVNINFRLFWAAAYTPSLSEKRFNNYAQNMWSESYPANVDILGQLHDILLFFNNFLTKFIFIQNKRKCKVCLPLYDFQYRTGCRSNCFRYWTSG